VQGAHRIGSRLCRLLKQLYMVVHATIIGVSVLVNHWTM
jgi:hypothetical protein